LDALVAAGHFRQDLYYRLHVIVLRTAPLKDRREDIEVLTRHFHAQISAREGLPVQDLSGRCLQCLHSHDWPGNVRELQNFIERLVVLGDHGDSPIRPADLGGTRPSSTPVSVSSAGSARVSDPAENNDRRSPYPLDPVLTPSSSLAAESPAVAASVSPPGAPAEWPTLEALEREHIRKTLERVAHNQVAAAKLLNIHRHQLARKIKRYGLETPSRQRRRRSTPPDV
jgi:DNA-binding NtrC family response regulator